MTAAAPASAVLLFADGGSRGNPGPAGYGAVVFAADGRTVLAERAASVGRATNNVAEYSGLIAGLQAAADMGARRVTVRMDSKLVIEQMSRRWQVKHPDMKPLSRQAFELAGRFDRIEFGWVPRAQNSHADRLANEAMDAAARGEIWSTTADRDPVGAGPVGSADTPVLFDAASIGAEPAAANTAGPDSAGPDTQGPDTQGPDLSGPDPFGTAPGADGSAGDDADDGADRADPAAGAPQSDTGGTRIIAVRHGETTWGRLGRFAGRSDVPLTDRGRAQAAGVAERIHRLRPDLVLTSPLQRCRDTAAVIAGVTADAPIGASADASAGATADGPPGAPVGDRTGGPVPVRVHEGLLDGLLGEWTGSTPAQIERRWPAEFAAWRSDADAAPPGGESFNEIRARVAPVVRDAIAACPGGTIVLVTHAAVTKMLLAQALGVPSAVAYRMRVDTASLSAFTVESDGSVLVWAVNETGHLPG